MLSNLSEECKQCVEDEFSQEATLHVEGQQDKQIKASLLDRNYEHMGDNGQSIRGRILYTILNTDDAASLVKEGSTIKFGDVTYKENKVFQDDLIPVVICNDLMRVVYLEKN